MFDNIADVFNAQFRNDPAALRDEVIPPQEQQVPPQQDQQVPPQQDQQVPRDGARLVYVPRPRAGRRGVRVRARAPVLPFHKRLYKATLMWVADYPVFFAAVAAIVCVFGLSNAVLEIVRNMECNASLRQQVSTLLTPCHPLLHKLSWFQRSVSVQLFGSMARYLVANSPASMLGWFIMFSVCVEYISYPVQVLLCIGIMMKAVGFYRGRLSMRELMFANDKQLKSVRVGLHRLKKQGNNIEKDSRSSVQGVTRLLIGMGVLVDDRNAREEAKQEEAREVREAEEAEQVRQEARQARRRDAARARNNARNYFIPFATDLRDDMQKAEQDGDYMYGLTDSSSCNSEEGNQRQALRDVERFERANAQ